MAENPSFQPQEEQPESKRQKMSTTSAISDDEERNCENPETILRKVKYKRRKVAIFFAYCGAGYQGMQKNPGAKTIEGDLQEALYFSGAVPEPDRDHPRRYDWARSARTDKGVSAVGQVVSGRFYVDPPGFIERLNSNLSTTIQIFGYKRATPSFSAKKFCDRRRYVYLIPVFALDPSCHRDRESVLASMGSENELLKCLDCSERGRKVLGVMGKRSYEGVSDNVEVASAISSNNISSSALTKDKSVILSLENNDCENNSSIGNEESEGDKVEPVVNNSNMVNSSEQAIDCAETVKVVGNGYGNVEDDALNYEKSAHNQLKMEDKSEFQYGDVEKERLNRILKHYEGTHNFHNFTTRTKAEDPAAIRYILSFNANTVISIDGLDFVKCEVLGQSFMLHQIRKMIGLAVAIMRDCSSESILETAFDPKVNMTVPMAPEVGLFLDECFFSSYNQKWKDSHEELSMSDYSDEAEEFKMKHIYSHVASAEHKDGSVALWLHSLNYRNYPDLRFTMGDGLCSDREVEARGS